MSNNIKTNIKFGGFYHSEHSDLIDSRIEMYEHEGYINNWELMCQVHLCLGALKYSRITIYFLYIYSYSWKN